MPTWTNFARACAIGAPAMIGAVVAVMADLVQKEAASAVLKITGVAKVHLGLIVSPLLWALGLVLLGVALCFVFEPATKKAAFYLGASIIALVMTAVPFQTSPTMATAGPEGDQASVPGPIVLAGLKKATFPHPGGGLRNHRGRKGRARRRPPGTPRDRSRADRPA